MTQQTDKLNSLTQKNNTIITQAIRNSFKGKYWMPLSAAVLCSSYAYALSLSDIRINSNLGEPLNATVFLNGTGNFRIPANCFSVAPQSGSNALPGISSASVSVSKVASGHAINISSSRAVNEPIAAITLASRCASLPNIQRTYTVMIDPAGVTEQRVAQGVYKPRNNTRAVNSIESSNAITRNTTINRSQLKQDPIRQGSTYIVQAGDTLSAMALRISDTPARSMWSVAASIFANNPQAFINRDPNFIEQGSSIAIPTFDANFVPNEKIALASLLPNNSSTLSNTENYSATIVQTNPTSPDAVQNLTAPININNQALATMTLSTQLSALSLQRIEARISGQEISPSLLPNTSILFGNKEQEDNQRSPLETAATSLKQAVEPKVVYVDRPAYPSEIEDRISSGIAAGIENSQTRSSFISRNTLTGLLATLVGLGLLTWKFILPFIKRRNRVAFIKSVRRHKEKNQYIARNKKRREALNRLPVNAKSLATEIEELSENILNRQAEPVIEKSPFELEQHAAEIEAAFAPAPSIKPKKSEPSITLNPSNKDDSQAVINKNNGPRKSNVAEKIYEVGMIDDTGELASLTMAFPELEAELNARLGGDIPDLGKDLPIQQQPNQTDINAETMTVQFERPLEDSVDFELPGLIDNDDGLEGDFERVVNDNSGEFSSTMVFNEEIFSKAQAVDPFNENSLESPTLSTEAIGPEDETRISGIMVDEDGLKASDFGLKDEDFPADKKDYSYLEPDASIETKALNLTPEELDAIGLGDDDDNIIPFSKKPKANKG